MCETLKERDIEMNFTEHTKIRKEKFGTVVFDTLTEKIFITDQIGGEILQLIEQDKDLPTIVGELGENFDGDKQMIEKDVIEFTDQLRANNIISVQE
jgi:hypothetical protein